MSGPLRPNTSFKSSPQDLIQDIPEKPSNEFVPFEKTEINQSISGRFERQVRIYPHHIAIKSGNRTVTYLELNEIANRTGRAILDQSEGGMKPIGLILEKDAPMIAAMLGVLKAGRAYVPLDPAHPPQRLQRLLDDASTELIITQNRCLSLAQRLAHSGLSVINIDEGCSNLSGENIGLEASCDTPCYIIYTSGSTGEPKGVVQSHRSVLHNIRWHTNSLRLCANDRLTLLASCAAGQSVTDIYAALLNGAALYPFDIRKEGLTALTTWLINEEITVYHSSASVFSYFVDSLSGNEEFPKLRFIKLGGEAVSKKDVDMYKKHFSTGCLLVNTLSATETGTVRQHMIGKNTTVTENLIPVGYPVEDKQILLLNETGQDVGFDEVGEICIDSPYLALGYWRQPDATSAVFTSSPEGGERRIYRSGDFGRMDRQGCLTYLGRNDSRVKISGNTIQIAEVEAALRGMVGIVDVAVAAREHHEEKKLVAYVVSKQGVDLGPSTLRKLLGEVLPNHMIPSSFVTLDALPRTPNGKVAREELPEPETSRPLLEYAAPRSDLEKKLERIWAKILKLDRVSIHDDFFDLGGYSLLAVKLIKAIEKVTMKKISPVSLFRAPTISKLAILLSASDSPEEDEGVIPIQPEGSKPAFFCIGDGFLYRPLALRLGRDQPILNLRIVRSDIQALSVPFLLEDIAACLVRKLVSVQPSGPYFIGGWCYDGLFAYEVAQQLRAKGEKVGLLVLFDSPNVVKRREYSKSQGFRSRLNLQARKVRRFLVKLSKVSWRGRWAYFCVALDYRQIKFRRRLWYSYYKFCLAIDDQVGGRFREHFKVGFVAVRNYRPKQYPGRVLLIWSASELEQIVQNRELSWRGLLVGSSEVHYIPGGHRDMFLEPNVRVLANKLKGCFSKAQQTDKESGSGNYYTVAH